MTYARHKLFRLFYKAFYTLLNAALFILILITPGDTIRQALDNNQLYNVFVIAGAHILTLFLAVLIYFSRIYTNKSILRSIPKTWIPVEKGDVSKEVRKMIVASLERSVAIAWNAKPRVPPKSTAVTPATNIGQPPEVAAVAIEDDEKGGGQRDGVASRADDATGKTQQPLPVWGVIAHDGWSSPLSPDLPNLQYINVILELPHLIEAKAVSLAPPDPSSTSQPPLADARAVEILQRPASTGLRDYIDHLADMGVIASPAVASDFLTLYEYARFSGHPISEAHFRDLMKQFAEVLRSIQTLSPSILLGLNSEAFESDIDDDGASMSTSATSRSRSFVSHHEARSRSGSEGTIRTAPSRRINHNGSPAKTQRTFSATPSIRQTTRRGLPRTPSQNSFAQSRRPYNGRAGSSSGSSLRSVSQASVIRLSRTNSAGYELALPQT